MPSHVRLRDPAPRSQPIDEKLWLEFKDKLERATLKGKPMGEERCDNCLYYLNPGDDISYCWHQQLRILVGAEWWEAIPEE